MDNTQHLDVLSLFLSFVHSRYKMNWKTTVSEIFITNVDGIEFIPNLWDKIKLLNTPFIKMIKK